MIELGNYNTLKILRSTRVGLFLGDEDVDDLLMPAKYIPDNFEIGDEIEVFCYLDNEERPVATTLTPLIKRNSFAFLKVADVNEAGAFLDWGLEKQLFVPFKEQPSKMVAGHKYLVYCYLDEKSFRLLASGRWFKYVDNENMDLKAQEEVELLVARKSDLGWDVIVNNKFRGLVFSSDADRELKLGDQLKGFVKFIRPDKKLDIVLRPEGKLRLEPAAMQIFERLQQNNGFIDLHDKSSPERIQREFQMSKKTFKRAVGTLYKARKITIKADGIYLNK